LASRGNDRRLSCGWIERGIMTFYVIAGIAFLFSLLVRVQLKSTYRRWGNVRNSADITGGQTARAILDANAMRGVPVEATRGKLTDHYDPRSNCVRPWRRWPMLRFVLAFQRPYSAAS
jgi:hypothetical protein